MLKFTSPLIRVAVLTAALGGFAVTAHAQDTDATPSTTPAPATAPAHSHSMMKKDGDMHVEQRIKMLHDKLKITADQEDDWSKVADVMRSNEAEVHDLIKDRHDNAASMTAVDDLESYEKILQAHADGLQKMITAFDTLYGNMSDDQKKNADAVFAHPPEHHGKMQPKK